MGQVTSTRSDQEIPGLGAVKTWGVLSALGFSILFILSVIFGSWYTINQTERGVILRFGNVVDVAGPGLHFKMPFITSVARISLETYTERVDKLNAGSADQQAADLTVSTTYRVNPEKVAEIYTRFQTLEAARDRIIKPRVQSRVKVVFGQFTAARTFSERASLNDRVLSDMQSNVDELFIVDSVQIENVEFDHAYSDSISKRMVAEVQVAQQRQELEKEKIAAAIANTRADAVAYQTRANGEAEAKAIRLKGEAEAAAIKAKSEALADSPNLVNLTMAQQWKGEPPQTVISGASAPAVPVLPLTMGK